MRRDILERLMEQRQRLGLRLGFDLLERPIDNALGNRFLAMQHDGIHGRRNHQISEYRVLMNFTLLYTVASGHLLRLSTELKAPASQSEAWGGQAYFGRFAPYLERRCLRSFTLCVSRTPRM